MPAQLILIDGSWWMHRAYHAVPLAQTSNGTPCNAVNGFCSSLIACLNKTLTMNVDTHIAAVMDRKRRGSFRSQLFPAYKGTRAPTPPDLVAQFDLVREACSAFGVVVVEEDEFEADDVIATLAREGEDDGMSVFIAAVDKDLMQCVTDRVRLVDPTSGTLVTVADVRAKFGVPPELMPDFLALVGDTVDNVPGVPLIGPKRAAELLAQYGSLEGILASDAGDWSAKVRKHAAQARLSKRLTKLRRHVELRGATIPELAWSGFPGTAAQFLRKMEFSSLVARIVDLAA